ncbi:MAG: 2-oxoacid:acceptor oxidoreductase family protein [Chloroflexi bacterium]|nr:2-oxoacid:acceptor oxidoreductase family protein [Chloroflexota bacterium]
MRKEIRLAGFGGQGVILSGLILAVAAGIHEEREVAQTQSYGPESRGGACRAEVVISDEEIDYIKCMDPDVLVAMSQPALDRYLGEVDSNRAAVLIDSSLVSKVPEGVAHLYPIPVTDIAEFKLGKKVVANMVMLGALSAITGIVSREGLEAAVRSTVPGKTIDLNLKALEQGYQEGLKLAQ